MINVSIALEVVSIFVAFVLLLYNFFEKKNNYKQTVILRMSLFATIIVLFSDILIMTFDGNEWFVKASYFFNVIKCICGYLIVSLYTFYVLNFIGRKRPFTKLPYRITGIYCVICVLIIFLSLINNTFFYIDENFHYQQTNLYWIAELLCFLEFLIVLGLVVSRWKLIGTAQSVFLISYSVFPLSGAIVQSYVEDIALFYVGITLSILMVYLTIHIEEEKHIQQTESLLLEANFKIMISQIKPHFLFNALTCIIDLCDTNPKVAKDTTIFFAHYLRNNLEAINNSNQIPFEQELKHIKNYLELEKVRFEGLKFNFEINVSNFSVPILSVQPLVENAVKYGIGKNGNKGTVTIKSDYDSDNYYVYVIDDGYGFDVSNYKSDHSRSHIGIDNCRERIVKQANGKLDITSEIGKGTTIKISIPKIY